MKTKIISAVALASVLVLGNAAANDDITKAFRGYVTSGIMLACDNKAENTRYGVWLLATSIKKNVNFVDVYAARHNERWSVYYEHNITPDLLRNVYNTDESELDDKAYSIFLDEAHRSRIFMDAVDAINAAAYELGDDLSGYKYIDLELLGDDIYEEVYEQCIDDATNAMRVMHDNTGQ